MVPTFLSVGLADRPPDRLDDVHLGAAGVDERDAVEGRHIDAFGEAAGVGQQTALPVVESAQVLEPDVPLAGGHLTRGVARTTAHPSVAAGQASTR